jgi:transcriptional regulator with XRE-family HTH domain
MTQADLARSVNTTPQAIYKYEVGIVTNIPIDKLNAIASALNVPASELAGWEEQSEEELDNQLISMLTKLTPTEAAKVEAFVQGLIANRAE